MIFYTNAQVADGTNVAINNIQNSTSAGIGKTAPSAADILHSYWSQVVALDVVALGFINGTDIVLIHSQPFQSDADILHQLY